jgi:hypothetical protein
VSVERKTDVAVPVATVSTPEASSAALPVQTAPVARVLPAATASRGALSSRSASPTALARVRALAGQLVPRLQYQLMRLGPAGQAGLAALAAALAVAVGAMMPAYHALETLSADLARAQHPLAGAGLEQAVPRLVASLPTRAQMPIVLGRMYVEAKSAGLPLDSGRYEYTPAKSGGIARYDLEFPVKGAGYPQIRSFIDRTLNAVPAASLSKLHIERKAVGDQVVNADIGFVVFVRSGEGT